MVFGNPVCDGILCGVCSRPNSHEAGPTVVLVIAPQAWERGAEHDPYRRRLTPELSANIFFVEETGEYGEQRLNHDAIGQVTAFSKSATGKTDVSFNI